ncbi:hypothetical protein D3C87_1816130 [compost metagenome]
MESAPRLASTVRSSITLRLAGSAPARNSTARSLAEAVVKLPLIWPEPPVIGCWITGAVMTVLSRTMAKRWPTLAEVISPKVMAPRVSNLKLTTGMPRCES